MAFPTSPIIGQTHEAFSKTWTLNGSGWSSQRVETCAAFAPA